jgi:hypothetical protein
MTATTKKAAASPKAGAKSPKPVAKSPKSVKKAVEKSPKAASPKPASPPPKADSPKKAPAAAPSPKKRASSATGSTKPKRALSAYFIWLGEVGRKDIIAKQFGGSGSDVAAIVKAAGAAWGKMSDKDKKPFQDKADKDKIRYAKEMESYVPSEDEPVKKKKGKKGKKEKDPNKPKKPSTAYMLWLTENRAEISKDPRVVKVTDVMKIAGEKWAKMDAGAKKKYETQAAAAKEKYDKAIAEYKANLPGDDDDDEDEE